MGKRPERNHSGYPEIKYEAAGAVSCAYLMCNSKKVVDE